MVSQYYKNYFGPNESRSSKHQLIYFRSKQNEQRETKFEIQKKLVLNLTAEKFVKRPKNIFFVIQIILGFGRSKKSDVINFKLKISTK